MKKVIFLLFIFLYQTYSSQEKWSIYKCIEYAKENNIQLINSKINEKISLKQEEITINEKLPSVSASFNNSISLGFQRTLFGTYEYNQSYTNNWSVDANMLLYNKGRLGLQNKKASIQTEIQQLNSAIIDQNISLEIASYYLQIVLNKELLQVAERQYQNSLDQLDKTQKLYSAGSIPYSTLVEQKAKNASDKSQVESADINIRRARFQLSNYLQIDDYTVFDVEDITLPKELNFEINLLQSIVEYSQSTRPEIKQAELQIEAAEKDIEIAKTAFWPTVRGGYGLSTNFFDFFDRKNNDFITKQWYDNHNQNIYVGVSIPIFNKFNTRKNVELAELNKELVSQNIQTQNIQLNEAIQTAYFDAETAFENYNNLKISFEAARTSESYAKKSYQAGKITIYDYNILQTNTIVAESQMIQAKYNFIFKQKVLDFYAGKEIEL